MLGKYTKQNSILLKENTGNIVECCWLIGVENKDKGNKKISKRRKDFHKNESVVCHIFSSNLLLTFLFHSMD